MTLPLIFMILTYMCPAVRNEKLTKEQPYCYDKEELLNMTFCHRLICNMKKASWKYIQSIALKYKEYIPNATECLIGHVSQG